MRLRGGTGSEESPLLSESARRERDFWRFHLDKGASLTGEFVSFEGSSRALKLCFLAILVYFAVAIVAFSEIFQPDWTFIDSLYFSVVTFTTVGYGGLVPTSDGSKIFTSFFVFFGIIILGVALGIIGDRLVQAQESAVDAVKSSAESRVLDMFSEDTSPEQSERRASVSAASVIEEVEAERPLWKDFCLFFCKEGPILIFILLLSIVMGHQEGWSYVDTFYYAIITTTTVGYGDITPQTQSMRLFAVFFIPLSVAVLASILGRIAGFYMQRQAAKHEKNFLEKELTLADLAAMDADGDGSVSLDEFLSFMLVAMQKVDKEAVDGLIEIFKRLDADGSGTLQKADLILLTQRNTGNSIREVV